VGTWRAARGMPEAERFAFVRAAVGAQNTSHIQSKLQKAREEVQKRLNIADRDYAVARSRTEEAIESLITSRNTALATPVNRENDLSARRSVGLPDTASTEELVKHPIENFRQPAPNWIYIESAP
jgi:hypothetical protein